METTLTVVLTILLVGMFIVESEALFMLMREIRSVSASLVPSRADGVVAAPHPFLLKVGEVAPSFSAVVYRTEKRVNSKALAGEEWVLAFFSAADIERLRPDVIRATVGGLWSKTDGLLIVVIMSSHVGDCGKFYKKAGLSLADEDQILLLADIDGNIASSYGVLQSPCAVVISANGKVRRVGQMSAENDDAAGEAGR